MRGFTVLEVLVALTWFGLGALGFWSLAARVESRRSDLLARRALHAGAQQLLEPIRVRPCVEPNTGPLSIEGDFTLWRRGQTLEASLVVTAAHKGSVLADTFTATIPC